MTEAPSLSEQTIKPLLSLIQGTTSAEIQAIAKARAVEPTTPGCTAYLNLETGDCHGDSASLSALIQAEVSRVVIGIRHPLAHCRGAAIHDLRQHGVRVDVLGEAPCLEAVAWEESVLQKCFVANEVCSLPLWLELCVATQICAHCSLAVPWHFLNKTVYILIDGWAEVCNAPEVCLSNAKAKGGQRVAVTSCYPWTSEHE